MMRFIRLVLLLYVSQGLWAQPSGLRLEVNLSTDVVEKDGISWFFKDTHEFGSFINGDPWVVGPITIVRISPECTRLTSGRVVNGSMVNPEPGFDQQGYDGLRSDYAPVLNVAAGLDEYHPLTLYPGQSLVSTISRTVDDSVLVDSASVLTVVASPPPSDAFRPCYAESDKEIYRLSQVNWANLLDLPLPSSAPDASDIVKYASRPWIDHMVAFQAGFYHPVKNMPSYGRDIADCISELSVAVHMAYDVFDKKRMTIALIQIGIDLYGVATNGGEDIWRNDGGHASGRKWPILFAGAMLGVSEMVDIGDISGSYINSGPYGPGNAPPDYIHFGEDDQTFYVSALEVGLTMVPDSRDDEVHQYQASDIGMPEWGITHSTSPGTGNKYWQTVYRQCSTGGSWAGFVLAAHLMGFTGEWNHPALFDYMDRYMDVSAGIATIWPVPGEEVGCRSNSLFVGDAWDTYR